MTTIIQHPKDRTFEIMLWTIPGSWLCTAPLETYCHDNGVSSSLISLLKPNDFAADHLPESSFSYNLSFLSSQFRSWAKSHLEKPLCLITHSPVWSVHHYLIWSIRGIYGVTLFVLPDCSSSLLPTGPMARKRCITCKQPLKNSPVIILGSVNGKRLMTTLSSTKKISA